MSEMSERAAESETDTGGTGFGSAALAAFVLAELVCFALAAAFFL